MRAVFSFWVFLHWGNFIGGLILDFTERFFANPNQNSFKEKEKSPIIQISKNKYQAYGTANFISKIC